MDLVALKAYRKPFLISLQNDCFLVIKKILTEVLATFVNFALSPRNKIRRIETVSEV